MNSGTGRGSSQAGSAGGAGASASPGKPGRGAPCAELRHGLLEKSSGAPAARRAAPLQAPKEEKASVHSQNSKAPLQAQRLTEEGEGAETAL